MKDENLKTFSEEIPAEKVTIPGEPRIAPSKPIMRGKIVGGKLDPELEEAYWRANHGNHPHADKAGSYETYQAAYRVGYEGYEKHEGKTFEEAEGDLQQNYYSNREGENLEWEKARSASRAAWDRAHQRKQAS